MTTKSQEEDPRAFLPLKPDLFHILLALSEEDLHGYGIVKAVEEATRGWLLLEPSPLYRRLRRLLEDGIVEPSRRGAASGFEDSRRQYYRLTAFGRSVLAAEAARLVDLAGMERVKVLAAGAEGAS